MRRITYNGLSVGLVSLVAVLALGACSRVGTAANPVGQESAVMRLSGELSPPPPTRSTHPWREDNYTYSVVLTAPDGRTARVPVGEAGRYALELPVDWPEGSSTLSVEPDRVRVGFGHRRDPDGQITGGGWIYQIFDPQPVVLTAGANLTVNLPARFEAH
jgi:hypothetical protein